MGVKRMHSCPCVHSLMPPTDHFYAPCPLSMSPLPYPLSHIRSPMSFLYVPSPVSPLRCPPSHVLPPMSALPCPLSHVPSVPSPLDPQQPVPPPVPERVLVHIGQEQHHVSNQPSHRRRRRAVRININYYIKEFK